MSQLNITLCHFITILQYNEWLSTLIQFLNAFSFSILYYTIHVCIPTFYSPVHSRHLSIPYTPFYVPFP